MKTITQILDALNKNKAATEKIHQALDLAVGDANKALADGSVPAVDILEEIDDLVKELAPVSMWTDALRVCYEYAESNKLPELSDEDAVIALLKAHQYTRWSVGVNVKTKRYEKKSKQVRYDFVSVFAKLGIDITAFKAQMSALLCGIALLAEKRISKGKNKDKILANYKGDDIIKKAISEAKNVGSLAFLRDTVGNAVNALLPSSKYKVTDEAAEFLYAVSTKLNQREICGVTAGLVKETYIGFFDFAHSLLMEDGNVRYNIAYKYAEIHARDLVTAEDKEDEATDEKPAEEAPKTEEKPKKNKNSKKNAEKAVA